MCFLSTSPPIGQALAADAFERYVGALSYEEVQKAVDPLLNSKKG